jgi:hypothetical protein
VEFYNRAADVPGLGVPGHVIAYFEFTPIMIVSQTHAHSTRSINEFLSILSDTTYAGLTP